MTSSDLTGAEFAHWLVQTLFVITNFLAFLDGSLDALDRFLPRTNSAGLLQFSIGTTNTPLLPFDAEVFEKIIGGIALDERQGLFITHRTLLPHTC